MVRFRISLFVILCCPFFLYGQYTGGVSDGAVDIDNPTIRLDGIYTEIPFSDGFGDGHDVAFLTASLTMVDLSMIYSGGRGDGHDYEFSNQILGLSNYADIFEGGLGDGHDFNLRQTTLGGTDFSGIYSGGIADGGDHDIALLGLDGFVGEMYSGGIGDGHDLAYVIENFSAPIAGLYSGGIGDGHDMWTKTDVLFPVQLCTTERIYVDVDAGIGSHNGASWQNAFTSLPFAFENAKFCPIESIWVSEGVYFPTTSLDRTLSFYPPSDVKILGGFSGIETGASQRNWVVNETILSGNIGTPFKDDNSYHVVDFSSTFGATRLDGFTIEQGNANDLVNGESSGAGIINVHPADEQFHFVMNTIIRNCYSIARGPAYYAMGGSSELQFRNVSIFNMNGPGISVLELKNNAKLRIRDMLMIDP